MCYSYPQDNCSIWSDHRFTHTREPVNTELGSEKNMTDEDQARIHAVKYLTRAIESHERGDFLSVSDGYNEYTQQLSRHDRSPDGLLFITQEFWLHWARSAERTQGYYSPILKDEWPKLARILLEDLKNNRNVTNKTILEHFVIKHSNPYIDSLIKTSILGAIIVAILIYKSYRSNSLESLVMAIVGSGCVLIVSVIVGIIFGKLNSPKPLKTVTQHKQEDIN